MSETTILDEGAVSEIEARAAKASVMPWEQRYIGSQGFTVWATAFTRTGSMQVAAFGHAEGFDQDNAEFTAHAREDIPALCATVKHLRADLRRAEHDAEVETRRGDNWERRAKQLGRDNEALENERDGLRGRAAELHNRIGERNERIVDLQSQLEQLRAERECAHTLFKNACRLHTGWMIDRYLMSNASNRLDPAEKAQRHIELCQFYVAAFHGCSPEDAMSDYEDDFDRLHEESQELTSSLNTKIGFPLDQTPDYADLNPKFFERFHSIACRVLGASTAELEKL